MMRLTQMNEAIEEAKQTLENARLVTNSLAKLLKGKLRQVNEWDLKELKKELSAFNSKTGEWNS